MLITIKGRLPSLNDIVFSSRGNVYKANNQKKNAQHDIMLQLPNVEITDYPVEIYFTFYEIDNRRDCDNIISGGVKLILDSMVKKGLLIDDSRKYVSQIHPIVLTDRENPRIEVQISGDDSKRNKGTLQKHEPNI